MKIFPLVFSVAALLAVVSCGKDDDNSSATTKTQTISSSAWVYESGGVDADRNGTIDMAIPASAAPSCRIDNTLLFKADNTGVTDEGTTKCNTTDPQTTPYNWSFASNETALNVSGNIFPILNGNFKIVALTATTFSLSKDTVTPLGTFPLLVNLKH